LVRTQTATMTIRIISATDLPIRIASILSSLTSRFFVGRIDSSSIRKKSSLPHKDFGIALDIPWKQSSSPKRYGRGRPGLT
jgi:hypothetical protein